MRTCVNKWKQQIETTGKSNKKYKNNNCSDLLYTSFLLRALAETDFFVFNLRHFDTLANTCYPFGVCVLVRSGFSYTQATPINVCVIAFK